MSVLTVWFLDKSNASSLALRRNEKSMSVCSGWMPQRVMICGISETTDRMASAPSPSELLSRLRWGKARCQGELTQKRTLRGGGLPQGGDLRLLEDGCERGDALGSDVVPPNTASEGWHGDGEREGVSMGADKATSGRLAPQLGDLRLLQDRGERGGALDSDVVPVETVRARGE